MGLVAGIREMIAKGMSLEDALDIAEAFEEQPEADNRTAHAKRQERYRERKRDAQASQSVTNVTPPEASQRDAKASQSVTSVTPLARVEDNPTTTEISGKKIKNNSPKASRGVTPTPREILLECLSPEIADAVLAHRKAKRCPLTVRAAQLLAKGFMATADPNAAADMMIERGWQGFKPEWFDNERAGNGQRGQSRKRSLVDAGDELVKRLDKQFAFLDDVRPADRGQDGAPTVRVLPGFRGQRP